jgi:hypothetical protein
VPSVCHARTLPFLVERLKAKAGESNKSLGHVRGFWELFRSLRKKIGQSLESDQFHFLRAASYANIKGSVGLIFSVSFSHEDFYTS